MCFSFLFFLSPSVYVLTLSTLTLCIIFCWFRITLVAVQESRRCHVETGCDSRLEKEPLFLLPGFPPVPQAHSEVSSSPGQQPQKKTLAATIVESTKKQSIALVPRDITKLSQRFFPLFNPALFPHKAPPSAVSNRVLFTDSEDE